MALSAGLNHSSNSQKGTDQRQVTEQDREQEKIETESVVVVRTILSFALKNLVERSDIMLTKALLPLKGHKSC
jgi:hypothetical protein